MNCKQEMIDHLWQMATDNGWDLDTDKLAEALTPFEGDETHLTVLREQSAGIGDDTDQALCSRCNLNPAEPEHPCPYDEELGDGCQNCDCCETCQTGCAWEI